jgi:formamidopyrimidine-DNA glycosylase
MPERPDLEYVLPRLDEALRGTTITGARVKKPVVLRVAIAGGLEANIVGRTIERVWRRAHFAMFEFRGEPPVEMAIAPMLAGRFVVVDANQKSPGDLAVAFALSDGRELRYRDDVQMGKVYVFRAGEWKHAPGLEHVGVDVLDAKKFTRAAFKKLARTRRDQAKVFLMDKSALDAMGNAYADEILWEAKIHPKTWVKSLTDEDLNTLHDAIVSVLTNARDVIAKRAPPLDEKIRDFLSVRNREGDPCPRCGTRIRAAGVHGHDAFFCPTCQQETRRGGIVDWRKLPPK